MCATTELHKNNDSQGVTELEKDAKTGGNIAGETRKNIEKQLKKSVVTSQNAKDFRQNKKNMKVTENKNEYLT